MMRGTGAAAAAGVNWMRRPAAAAPHTRAPPMVANDELISALWAARLFGCLSFSAQRWLALAR
jgi:hypothetical protein